MHQNVMIILEASTALDAWFIEATTVSLSYIICLKHQISIDNNDLSHFNSKPTICIWETLRGNRYYYPSSS